MLTVLDNSTPLLPKGGTTLDPSTKVFKKMVFPLRPAVSQSGCYHPPGGGC